MFSTQNVQAFARYFPLDALLFKLLLIDMHRNCMRTDFKVFAYTVSLPDVRMKIYLIK